MTWLTFDIMEEDKTLITREWLYTKVRPALVLIALILINRNTLHTIMNPWNLHFIQCCHGDYFTMQCNSINGYFMWNICINLCGFNFHVSLIRLRVCGQTATRAPLINNVISQILDASQKKYYGKLCGLVLAGRLVLLSLLTRVLMFVYLQHGGGEDNGVQTAAGRQVQLQEAEPAAEQDDRQLYSARQESQRWVSPGPVPPQHLLPADREPGTYQVQAAEWQQLAEGGGGRPWRSVQEDHSVSLARVRGPTQGCHLPGGRAWSRHNSAGSRGYG